MTEKSAFWPTYKIGLDLLTVLKWGKPEIQPDIPLEFLIERMEVEGIDKTSKHEVKQYILDYLERHQIKNKIAQQYKRTDSIAHRNGMRIKSRPLRFEEYREYDAMNWGTIFASQLTNFLSLGLIPIIIYFYNTQVLRNRPSQKVLDDYLNIMSDEISRNGGQQNGRT